MTRATKAELEERTSFTHRLMEMGLSSSTIVAQVQRHFGVSRATAFRALTSAADERDKDTIELAAPKGAEVLHEAIGVLHDSFVTAAIDGELKEVSKLSRELRETVKCLGMAVQHEQSEPESTEA